LYVWAGIKMSEHDPSQLGSGSTTKKSGLSMQAVSLLYPVMLAGGPHDPDGGPQLHAAHSCGAISSAWP
jgi:hypothetical protein